MLLKLVLIFNKKQLKILSHLIYFTTHLSIINIIIVYIK